jgi:uncharacterized coiled-coil DUF342 family protein
MSLNSVKEDLSRLIDARIEDLNAVILEVENSVKEAGQSTRDMVERAVKELKEERDELFEKLVALRQKVAAAPEEVAELREQAEARWLDVERRVSELLWELREEGDAVRRIVAARVAAQGLAWSVRLEILREEYEARVAKAQAEIEESIKAIESDLDKVSRVSEISREAFGKIIADIKRISGQSLSKIKNVVA